MMNQNLSSWKNSISLVWSNKMDAAYYTTTLSVLIGVLTFTTSQAYNAAIKAELESIQQFFPAAARTWRWIYAGTLTFVLVWLTLYAASQANTAEKEEIKEVKKEAKKEAKLAGKELAKALGIQGTPQKGQLGMQQHNVGCGSCNCCGGNSPTTIRLISQ